VTEAVTTRRCQFRLAAKGNVKEIAKKMNKMVCSTVNKNICEASVSVDPKDATTIVVEMKCATGQTYTQLTGRQYSESSGKARKTKLSK